VYFTTATLCSAGLNPIPDNSPEWIYGLVGAYAAIGVILQLIVVYNLVSSVLQETNQNKADKLINEKIHEDELEALREIGLEDEATVIDKHEYLALMLVRLGLVDTEMINHIHQKFDNLDAAKTNKLSIAKLLGGISEDSSSEVSLGSTTDETSPLTRPSSNRDRDI